MRRRSSKPSPTWRRFLETHLSEIAAALTFRLLFGFIILRHHRRELVHINVTGHPTAEWAAHQVVDAFPYESAPRYLLHDRDAIYGSRFTRRIAGLGMQEIRIAPRAPWQNPFAERLIGSIRRECLDHVIVLNECHLRRLLRAYLAYYNNARPH
jgi:putative transposase